MEIEKKLGKISRAHFGLGGYNDAMLGLHLSFEGTGFVVGTYECFWDTELIECTKHCKWTEADRDAQISKVCRLISKTLKDAKKDSVEKLVGVPVELSFEAMTLKSWRILTEVI